jgi:hypothetical protein
MQGAGTLVRLSLLCTVQGTVAAAALEGALRAEGIPAMTRGEQHTAWLFPGASGGLGPVDVLVPDERLEEARAVLAAFEEDEEA